ncbi:hypothetical protein ACXYN8_13605 [Altererythrobacter sp. CAU 1778]
MINTTTDVPKAELRWRGGALGFLLVCLLFGASALIGLAAIVPDLATDMQDSRHLGFIRLTHAVSFAGINLPLALLALYLLWEAFRFAWRLLDNVAVKATDWGLRLHRSTLQRSVAWEDVKQVTFKTVSRAPSLVILLKTGATQTIRGLENSDCAGEEFAVLANQLASDPESGVAS